MVAPLPELRKALVRPTGKHSIAHHATSRKISWDFKMNIQFLRMRRAQIAICSVTCMLFAASDPGNLLAQDVTSVAEDAAMVQPFITESTAVIVKVDPKRVALPNLPDGVKSMLPGGIEGYSVWSQSVTKGFDRLRAATEGQATYATIGIPLSKNEWPAFVFMKETSAPNQKQFADLVESLHESQSAVRNGVMIVMPGHDTDVEARLDSIVPSPRQELKNAFESVKDYPVQILLLPPDYVRRTVIELMPELPRHLGGGPSSLLSDGLMWAALGVDVAGPRIELVMQSNSEKAAHDLSAHLPKMMLSAHGEFDAIKASLPQDRLQKILPLVKPTVAGSRISIRLDDPKSISEMLRLMASAPSAVGEQIRRRTNSDNFRQILLGLHNYHGAYRSFPPRDEDRDADGKSRLSWRVHILPFIEQKKLYDEFKLDEPWDSAHNKPLIDRIPKIYASQSLDIKPGHTTFLAPVGEDTIFGGKRAMEFGDIVDGTSNTMVLVEVNPRLAVPWTAPQDYVFDPKAPGRGLRVGTDGRFLAAMGDGSVQMLRGAAPAVLLLRLFRKSDGETINWKAIR